MRYGIILILLSALIPAAALAGAGQGNRADNDGVIHVGKFSDADPGGGIPQGWEPLTFEKIEAHTDYRIVDYKGETVVRAQSDSSASGLIRKIRIDPMAYPVIEWRWQITGTYEKGDVARKSGDDYPARIYIAFEYDPENAGFLERAKFRAIRMIHGQYPPVGAINYIWASNAPKGKIVPNAFTDRAQMIVVRTGKDRANSWVSESRNIVEDYRKAFGQDPPMITGIAIMTDSDNTGESAVTYYGDIAIKPAQ